MLMWKTGERKETLSRFLGFLGSFIIRDSREFLALLGASYYRTRAECVGAGAGWCCEQNNWSSIQPSGPFYFSFSIEEEEKKREEKRGTTGRRVIFSVLCCYVMGSSHLLLVSFHFIFWFCCWDVMEFQMSFWGRTFFWLGWILISYTPADTRNNNNNNSQPATSAGSVYMDEKQFLFFPDRFYRRDNFCHPFWQVEYQACSLPAACWDLIREFMQGFLGGCVPSTPPPYIQVCSFFFLLPAYRLKTILFYFFLLPPHQYQIRIYDVCLSSCCYYSNSSNKKIVLFFLYFFPGCINLCFCSVTDHQSRFGDMLGTIDGINQYLEQFNAFRKTTGIR